MSIPRDIHRLLDGFNDFSLGFLRCRLSCLEHVDERLNRARVAHTLKLERAKKKVGRVYYHPSIDSSIAIFCVSFKNIILTNLFLDEVAAVCFFIYQSVIFPRLDYTNIINLARY
jgi:hypothetical protein